ncbi:MAG TPA: carboxypeptidase-like regulatory domain-containing protein, partial [Flavisolibacter sp.]|nr:carboxypeptidase-like regulatory domain-containing protein [Flavisolibacter sp.]
MKIDFFKRKPYVMAFMVFLFIFMTANVFAQIKSSIVRGVVQGSYNQPLAGVSVTVRNAKTNFASGTSTDSLGMITFSKLPSGGPYSFTFTSIGYDEQTLS